MRNTLTDLNDYLFEAIERVQDDTLAPEDLDNEIKKADTVMKIAGVIINNGKLALDTMKHLNEMGYTNDADDSLAPVPKMLEAGK